MTDRDYFAAAALIRGMGVLGCEQIAKSCYEMADVMLRERERHHIPDAGTLTDAEREAVEWFAEVRKPLTRLTQSHNRERYKATLHGLLERLG
jgi:hypothetical protein